MEGLKTHPIAALFPMLPEAELRDLADDIHQHGLQQPIVIQGDTLLDGRNRLAACELASVEPIYREYEGDDPTAFIISANLKRRHLTESQRGMIAGKMANMLQGNYSKAANLPLSPISQPEAAKLMNVSVRTIRDAKVVSDKSPELAKQVEAGEITINAAKREVKRKEARANIENIATKEAKATEGVYDVIVIDPPWPMEKIERDVRPNQSEFDYPTMTEAELEALKIPSADDCHVWLWTTHKFLPMALRLLTVWGLKYVCTFVWHKPGGFQPYGLPQYNCEFSIYARKGTPQFVDTKAFPLCFSADRGKHSEKPESFYDVVRRVTVGRRLDMFNRRSIDGFDVWGKEAD